MNVKWKYRISGAAAGLVSGLFGGGDDGDAEKALEDLRRHLRSDDEENSR